MPTVEGNAESGAPRRRIRTPVGLLLLTPLALGCAWWATPYPLPPPRPPAGVLAAVRPAPGPGDPVAVGFVFEDANRNGARDEGERGIPGVRVSNGVDVVQSDERGRYRIPVDRDSIVFVIKPRDWAVPLDANRIPRFYRIHKPDGSPDAGFVYPGVAPTGPLPDSIDFPLTPQPELDRFEVVAIGDPQPYTPEQLSWYAQDTLAELVGSEAAFGISLGDLVGNDLALLPALNDAQAGVGIPWYSVLGNHDMNFMSPDDRYSDETFERVYGPATYAFQVARVHFVVLDDVIWGGFQGHYHPDGRPYNQNYVGGFREDQVRFLERFLETVPDGDLVVLAMHIPITRVRANGSVEPQRILEVLARHPRSLSLSAHSHTVEHQFFGAADGFAPDGGGQHHHFTVGAASGNRFRGVPDELGIPHATMRDGSPNGYSILRFDGDRYEIRYKASRRPADYQMNIDAPARLPSSATDGPVLVNVFAGSQRSRVEMRVESGTGKRGDWALLERLPQVDPFYEADRMREQNVRLTWQPLQSPRESSHIWVGRLPADLPSGTHWIEVRSTDMFGNTQRGRRMVRVDPRAAATD